MYFKVQCTDAPNMCECVSGVMSAHKDYLEIRKIEKTNYAFPQFHYFLVQ